MIYEMTNFHTFWQAKLHYRHNIIYILGGYYRFFLSCFGLKRKKQRMRECGVKRRFKYDDVSEVQLHGKKWVYTMRISAFVHSIIRSRL